MQGRRFGLQTDRAPELFDQEKGGDLAHPKLHRREADKLAIKRFEQLTDIRLAVERVEIKRWFSRSQHHAPAW